MIHISCEMDRHNETVCKGNTTTLYHQTTDSASDCILMSGQMKPGVNGLAGAGIYFAITPEQTNHKALYKGVILECEVVLGTIMTVDDKWITGNLHELVNLGFDSVQLQRATTMLYDLKSGNRINRLGGTEYIIYDSAQVKSIKKYTGSTGSVDPPPTYPTTTVPQQMIKPHLYKIVNGHMVKQPVPRVSGSRWVAEPSPLVWKKDASGSWQAISTKITPKIKAKTKIKVKLR